MRIRRYDYLNNCLPKVNQSQNFKSFWTQPAKQALHRSIVDQGFSSFPFKADFLFLL